MTTIGFIYPDHAAEDDYPLAQRLLGEVAQLPVAHIYGTDLHAVDELRDLGSEQRLAEGAAKLAPHSPSAVVWACTSGSFVFGHDGAAEQVTKLSRASGTPASSTSFAFVRAAQRLGLRRVAVTASYPNDIAELFVQFLTVEGIDVIRMSSAGFDTAAEVGGLTDQHVLDLALSGDHPDADAVLIPDTAMRTISLVGAMEDALGKPVLTANQVSIWEGLRIAGVAARSDALGELFRHWPDDGTPHGW
ncbi:maleate cis-trans isomerase [Haloechinothrix sp. LS1_15]|uniref:maleate cis-trans isomerase family protein n=1 Tax=Haloechinothrix sp. LS1_15 TaxID=2652248 RepID=UPI002945CB62|nr:maleate cis-trans isomerase [Haloechinothrix sp. LS1_15]MDV6011725.1 maleate cis-trans isomerase [Haloechinothrix sp. LS1_15]